ncbi:MAG: CcmD family protein [Chitinophagaceae bacterium]|nr:MAG: CcmD family protein [Chitinophagaceae bacterium]
MKPFLLLLVSFFTIGRLAAQGAGSESAIGETMRSSGRIYVVVAVMLTILAGLVLYLIRLDRRISKLEKE